MGKAAGVVNAYLLKDIAEWFESESIGLEHGAKMFSGRLPDTEQDAVAVLHYASGRPVTVLSDDGVPVADKPLVQVLTRFADYEIGFETAIKAHNAMIALHGVTFLHTRFVSVMPLQSPFYIGDTEDDRPLFSCNYELETEDV